MKPRILLATQDFDRDATLRLHGIIATVQSTLFVRAERHASHKRIARANPARWVWKIEFLSASWNDNGVDIKADVVPFVPGNEARTLIYTYSSLRTSASTVPRMAFSFPSFISVSFSHAQTPSFLFSFFFYLSHVATRAGPGGQLRGPIGRRTVRRVVIQGALG